MYLMLTVEYLSYVFGIISTLFYSVVYLPQFYVIYKTKSIDGISVWMLLMWGQADFLSLVGTILLSLEISLIAIGWYHACVGFLMTMYVLYHDKQSKDKILYVVTYYVANISVCLYLNIYFIQNVDIGLVIGWITSVLYIIGRFPQFMLNIKRRSTEGLSIYMYVFTILGNIFYLLAVLSFSVEREYILLNLPWIIMIIITVTLDFIVIGQMIYYSNAGRNTLELDNQI